MSVLVAEQKSPLFRIAKAAKSLLVADNFFY